MSGPAEDTADSIPPRQALRQAVQACRRAFVAIGVFSAFLNLLVLAPSLYMLQVYDRVLTTRHVDTLVLLSLMATAAILVMTVLDALRGRIMTRIGIWLDRRLSAPVLATTLGGAVRRGGASAQSLRDLETVRTFVGGGSLAPLFDAPWIPVYLAIVWLMHPVLGVVATLGTAVLFALAVANDLTTRALLKEANAEAARRLNAADAAIRNADVIAAMGVMPNLLRLWDRSGEGVLARQQQASDRAGWVSAAAKFVRYSMQTAILGFGAWLVIRHEATGGVMIAASIIMGRAVAPVEQAIGTWKGMVATQSAYRRIREQLAGTGAPPSTMTLPQPRGALSVEKAYYAPPGSAEPVLKSVSFELQPGEVLGVIGPSAAGKTTLARLLVGSIAPSAGSVRLDGAEMTVWDDVDRGRHVGYLPQDVELFNTTVRANIARLGDAPDEAVFRAAELAGVHDLVLRLPRAYDTGIGPGGVVLSGGQRQRVGLARAVFGQPRLIVMDEPNSNLDGPGEQALLDAVGRLKQAGSTLVIIAHRPSVMAHVDKILVLRDGAVAGFGPRDEVMAELMARAGIEPLRAGPRPVVAASEGR